MRRADQLALEHFNEVCMDTPDTKRSTVPKVGLYHVWRKDLTPQESGDIFTMHITRTPDKPVGGEFDYNKDVIYWKVLNGDLIVFTRYIK